MQRYLAYRSTDHEYLRILLFPRHRQWQHRQVTYPFQIFPWLFISAWQHIFYGEFSYLFAIASARHTIQGLFHLCFFRNEDLCNFSPLRFHLRLLLLFLQRTLNIFRARGVCVLSLLHRIFHERLYYLVTSYRLLYNLLKLSQFSWELNMLNLYDNMPSHTFHRAWLHLWHQTEPKRSFLFL